MIDLVTAHAAQVVAFRIEKQAFDERARVGGRGRVAGTQAAIDVLERFFLILGRVFLQAFNDDPVVHGGVHDANLGGAQFGNQLDHRLGQRLERAGDRDAFFRINGVFNQDLVLDIFQVFRCFNGKFFDVVIKLQDIRVRAVAERAEESGGQEFPAALLPVKINIKQIAGVKLRFIPGAAVGNDAERMQRFAVRVLGRFKRNAGRAVQLADDDAFGAVDDKRALRGHQRQLAHEHGFLLRSLLVLELKGDVEGRSVGDAFAQTLQPVLLRLADLITVIIQFGFAVVARDRENLFKDRLQAERLPFGGRRAGLQKLDVRIDLDFDQVRRRDDFFDFTEVDPLWYSRWHF